MKAAKQPTFHDKVEPLITGALICFQKISKKYFLFNLAFALLVACEIVLIGFFFSPLVDTYFLGIAVALLFFTLLLYFILRLYYHEQKPEEFTELRDEFLSTCKDYVPFEKSSAEYHLALASLCCRMNERIEQSELSFYKVPEKFHFLAPVIEKASLRFHMADIHKMQELFLCSSINEHIKLIKQEPTSLDAHAATANAYVMLSALYSHPKTVKNISSNKRLQELKRKHRLATQSALEEFKILSEYAPLDPWVHEQLAFSFHNLQMPKEEIAEYETILTLKPNDLKALFTLGQLYFNHGEQAKGLKVYEKLKQHDVQQAQQLIQNYRNFVLS